MINPFHEIDWTPDIRARRQFAKALIVGFPCVAVMLLVLGGLRGAGWNVTIPVAVGGTGVALGAILWLAPQIARPFYLVWHVAGAAVGFVISNLILVTVYLLLVVPIGVTMRAFGRRALIKHFDRTRPTYWIDAQTRNDPASYYRQF